MEQKADGPLSSIKRILPDSLGLGTSVVTGSTAACWPSDSNWDSNSPGFWTSQLLYCVSQLLIINLCFSGESQLIYIGRRLTRYGATSKGGIKHDLILGTEKS